MKMIPLCCVFVLMLSGASAQQDEIVQMPPIPSSSLKDKDALKKIPRLGMNRKQLDILWGECTGSGGSRDSREYFITWGNVGGVNLVAHFIKGISESGRREQMDTEPCDRLTFSYMDDETPLVFSEAVRIAEALLPGFAFEKRLKDQEEEHLFLTSTDKNKTYQLFKCGKNTYSIEFTNPPKSLRPEKKIDTDKL